MNTKSQTERILSWLERGESITPALAYIKFDCLRLSGRIKELRDAGHNIQTTMITTPTKKRVASYRLEK